MFWKNRQQSRNNGQQAEDLACQYLTKQSLKLLERNYRTKCGEIDLIMRDSEHLVFVEVRFRRNDHFGTASETVTRRKQARLVAAASYYLQAHFGSNLPACRFDIISICPVNDQPKLEWIKDAFQSTS